MQVYYKNGFYYIKDSIIDLPWLSENNMGRYFLLNNTTRKLFKDEVLPLIKSGQCYCDPNTLIKIRDYKQVKPKLFEGLFHYKIIEPDPKEKPLMPHQIESVKRMLQYYRYGFFLGTGTGKTLIVISYLLSAEVKRALIITPKKVVDQYRTELDKYIPGNDHIVTNYEQAHKYVDDFYTCLILDESHKVKNKSSNIWETLSNLAMKCQECYLFTGTPQDKHRHEIMSQLSILYPHFIPGKTHFINRYFNLDDYYKPKSEKSQFSKELTEMIESCTWGKRTEEVVDLSACPEVTHIIKCSHPHVLYDELKKDRFYEFPTGAVVVADNKAKLKLKLREICSGFVMIEKVTEEGRKTGTKTLSNTKATKLLELLKTLKNGIIFTEFDHDIKVVSSICNTLDRSYVVVNGKTRKSAELSQRFKDGEVDFLIIQSRSGNAGLDLTCTNNVIFYTLPESYIVYHQCQGRIRRKGQTKECNYYYLLCDGTIEEDILDTLKRKKSYTTKVFKIYK